MARRMFASDNASGVHPVVLEALARANVGHAHAYGYDPWTERALAVLKRHFGDVAEPFFVFNGTGANVTALQALMRPFHAVICPVTAHINVDECGAPERFTGGKVITVTCPDGKISRDALGAAIAGVGVEHHSQPRVVSITQATEYGTVYTPDELRAITDAAHARGLLVHMDGARLANAAAYLGCGLADITTDVGVDVVSLGGTKNGLLYGEAVVFLSPDLADGFRFIRKQSAQLASKMRFIAVQFEVLYGTDLWLRNAAHANAMARLLAEGMAGLPGVTITQPVQANEVFAIVPKERVADLQAVADFYVWDERVGEVRWVTSWDTTHGDVEAFVEGASRILGG